MGDIICVVIMSFESIERNCLVLTKHRPVSERGEWASAAKPQTGQYWTFRGPLDILLVGDNFCAVLVDERRKCSLSASQEYMSPVEREGKRS